MQSRWPELNPIGTFEPNYARMECRLLRKTTQQQSVGLDGRRQPLKREFRIGASWTFCQDEIRFRGIVGRIVVNLLFYNFKHENLLWLTKISCRCYLAVVLRQSALVGRSKCLNPVRHYITPPLPAGRGLMQCRRSH